MMLFGTHSGKPLELEEVNMEIVVTGRHTQIKQRFRDVVETKMNRVTAIAPDAQRAMELIGHDFFLFVNKETGRPSVVYHRHGWSYGVFEIDTPENVKKD